MPEEPMEGQLARELISFAKAQWLNHASKNSRQQVWLATVRCHQSPGRAGVFRLRDSLEPPMSSLSPISPHLPVTILILRKGRERARAKAKARTKERDNSVEEVMGNQATREGRPMVRMITAVRPNGRGAILTLGTGTPKEDGTGSGTESRKFPYLILALHCFACLIRRIHR